VLANVGVIAGIVFLGLELRQNNSLLRAEASYNLLQNRVGYRADIVRDAEFAEFWARTFALNAPSTDQLRMAMPVERTMLNLQFEYGQYVDGNLADGEFSMAAVRNVFSDPVARRVWEDFRNQLRPDFVEWVEENVAAEGP
jgi:hypothetical protein